MQFVYKPTPTGTIKEQKTKNLQALVKFMLKFMTHNRWFSLNPRYIIVRCPSLSPSLSDCLKYTCWVPGL